jgi:hypothetical protein
MSVHNLVAVELDPIRRLKLMGVNSPPTPIFIEVEIQGDAFWSEQCTCYIPGFDEQYFLLFPEKICLSIF